MYIYYGQVPTLWITNRKLKDTAISTYQIQIKYNRFSANIWYTQTVGITEYEISYTKSDVTSFLIAVSWNRAQKTGNTAMSNDNTYSLTKNICFVKILNSTTFFLPIFCLTVF